VSASIENAKALHGEAPLFKKGIIAWSMSPLTLTHGTALSSKN
jgi:hypothetical protein